MINEAKYSFNISSIFKYNFIEVYCRLNYVYSATTGFKKLYFQKSLGAKKHENRCILIALQNFENVSYHRLHIK